MYTNWYTSWQMARIRGRDLRQAAGQYRLAMLGWVAVPAKQVIGPALQKAISRRLVHKMADV